MEDLLNPSSNDPDSSLPSLFPYDSFPIPKGLYTKSNSSKSSISKYQQARDDEEEERDEKAVSTPRGKILVGQDLLNTVRRPSRGETGLAPALPVSPPRTNSSKSSPATSPSRYRRTNPAELRNLAQKQRIRDFQEEDGALPSQRASRSTIASFTSTESIYEDAIEPESENSEAEEVLLDLDLPDTNILPPLDMDHLPDTPPDLEVPDREPRSRQITPRPNQTQVSPSFVASPTPLSPESISTLDERSLYEQRQVELQAEAKRRANSRLSISSLPVSPRGPPSPSYRRHSGVLPLSPGSSSHVRRLSLASALSPPVSGARHWHPKPLVLTPARTMSTPLTSEPQFPPSPQRHLSIHEGIPDAQLRTHSRGSSYNDGTIRTVSPLSPGGYSASSRSTSPFQSSPKRQNSLSGNPRRRSLGYVDSSNEPLSTFGRRAMSHDRRGRSASEDTRATRTTIDSGLTRFTVEDETPESSSGGWSDERKPSPLLDDKEWEQQWQVNGSTGGTPLESVAEVSLGNISPDIAKEEEEEEDQTQTTRPLFSSVAPVVRRRAATDDRRSTTSGSSRSDSLIEASFATVRPTAIRRDSVPPTPPPKLPLPRPPPARQNSSPLPKKRTRQKYDERWNGETLSQDQGRSSISSVGDEDSDVPVSPKKPSFNATGAQSSSPRRPIVIKGTTSRSAAALARRSARLSLSDPPAHPPSSDFDRSSTYSSERQGSSRPSSRGSRHTVGHSSREASQELRFGGPLATLPESDSSPSPLHDFSPRFRSGDQQSSNPRSERSQSRASYSSPRISIGSTFANGFGATRRMDFEPRDPRTREELDAGSGSYLEVLLYSEPPPRTKPAPARWSTTTSSTSAHSQRKEAVGNPLIRSDSPPSIPAANKAKSSNNFAQKIFGSFRGKEGKRSSVGSNRRPMSMIVQNATPAEPTKPRPIVSGPLELQKAELERQQQGQESVTAPPQNLSVSFAPPIPVMKSYTSLARVYEEESQSQLNRSASLETIERPPPRPFSLPPGLVASSSSDSLRPPVPPVKPPRSPLRPSPNSGNELLQPGSPRAVSPVHSFKSFQSQRPSIGSNTGRSSIAASEPIGVRDVLRGQFLER